MGRVNLYLFMKGGLIVSVEWKTHSDEQYSAAATVSVLASNPTLVIPAALIHGIGLRRR